MTYNLSEDYDQLYELLCQGFTAVGFVDYSLYGNNVNTSRDVVKIHRYASFDIRVSARGIQYGGVDLYWKAIVSDEKPIFIRECRRMNLKFIQP